HAIAHRRAGALQLSEAISVRSREDSVRRHSHRLLDVSPTSGDGWLPLLRPTGAPWWAGSPLITEGLDLLGFRRRMADRRPGWSRPAADRSAGPPGTPARPPEAAACHCRGSPDC